jgi:hypothetical protein
VREDFRWSRALAPLIEFCRRPVRAADRDVQKKNDSGSGVRKVKVVPRTGIRRDLDRAAYYLREGGVSAVVERYRARADRRRQASQP